jgi:NitT/TauT family transport system ATP-binding protein
VTTAVALARPVIRAVGVGKRFGAGPTAVQALSEIDLTVEDGEFITLIGPSGCGKSTLLRLIGDLLEPTAGEIQVNAKPARQARLDRDYGMVFQAPVLMDWRTIAGNIELPLEIQGFPSSERSRRSAELLHLVELEGVASSHPWQLSGGMQQRVAIARALASAPGLLLMDEPFGALDEMTRERLNLQLMNIWTVTGTTVLFVTHSIPEAVFLSTRVVVMSSQPGRISRIIEIDLPQPRTAGTREAARFLELVGQVRAALRTDSTAMGADQ